jgi:hypothetical protein
MSVKSDYSSKKTFLDLFGNLRRGLPVAAGASDGVGTFLVCRPLVGGECDAQELLFNTAVLPSFMSYRQSYNNVRI